MASAATSTRFQSLPVELQCEIIKHTFELELATRNNIIKIEVKSYRERKNHPPLPAIFHINRLFRTEALRLAKSYGYRLIPALSIHKDSLILFDPQRDTLELRRSKNLPVDQDVLITERIWRLSDDLIKELQYIQFKLSKPLWKIILKFQERPNGGENSRLQEDWGFEGGWIWSTVGKSRRSGSY